MGSFPRSVRENTKKPSTFYHCHHESSSLLCATATIPIFFILLSSRSQITTLIISILNLLTISLSSQWSTLEPTFVILWWYYCDILTIILSSSSSSSSSSKWSNLEPTFVIWCGRGGRWLLDKLPSLELITSLQSDQDYHVVLMIIMCQFCLFLLVQSHRILCCWHFSKSYIKSISFAAGFSNRLVKGKNRKETDADIYLFFGREILGLSQKFRKSWGYHSFKDFLEFLLTNTFFCLVQYGAKVEICGKHKIFYRAENENNISNSTTDPGVECFD